VDIGRLIGSNCAIVANLNLNRLTPGTNVDGETGVDGSVQIPAEIYGGGSSKSLRNSLGQDVTPDAQLTRLLSL
jgi:hypothetical protein